MIDAWPRRRGRVRNRGGSLSELGAFVPFNLRRLGEPRPSDPGNRFGPALVSLPVGLHDPQERLERRLAADTAGGVALC
jgi:hypothetical protein